MSDQYFVQFHDNPGLSQVMLVEEFYTTDVDGVPGSWCLQSHVREGIFRDADMSRAWRSMCLYSITIGLSPTIFC